VDKITTIQNSFLQNFLKQHSMHLFETADDATRIHELIRKKATGTPVELAAKLDICERQVYRILSDFKDEGLPIKYSKALRSYYYSSDVFMKFELSVVENGQIRKIIGGEEKKSEFNDVFFQTDILRQFERSPS
jgi:transcription initiation factor IIE alpha subunit